jgi:phosphotransferase system HPr (HPr) family protein
MGKAIRAHDPRSDEVGWQQEHPDTTWPRRRHAANDSVFFKMNFFRSNIRPFPSALTRASREVTLQNLHGLHVRQATEFVRRVMRFQSTVTIRANGRDYQADRIIDIVLAELNCGDTFILEAEGPDAFMALDRLFAFLSSLKAKEEGLRDPRRRQIEATD